MEAKRCYETLSRADIERALARADALHRALAPTTERDSPYPRILDGNPYAKSPPPFSTLATPSRLSLGKFNGTTATYSWPILPKTPSPPLCYEINKANSSARQSSVSSSTESSNTLSPPTSNTFPAVTHTSWCPENSRFDRRAPVLAEPFKVKLEDDDMGVTIAPLRPATFDDTGFNPQTGSRSGSDSPPARQMMLAIPEESPHWSDYARETKTARGEGGAVWTCRWTTTLNGVSNTCTYTGKKQLVKRHIETTHLKKKPYICEFCGEKFPQRTSLRVHTSSKHTRDYPWKCPDCSVKYNDPARLHRHRMDVHDYVPRTTNRNVGKHEKNPGPKPATPQKIQDGFEVIPFSSG
ncbi:hypothetical protein K435DRAFT_833007 [Dendrothele bispora CBS 962.96]|uniref:C2H2-type domain-containing protein n=1 Tax=Dendrothele bispora (strain CBS 962.96) TaxID=1314807 RepID=A0A4S8MZJ2_DENBC|nr:hypothetical protein K435DRAFT_833007 [Dendrothele bispora CBS 962.96]